MDFAKLTGGINSFLKTFLQKLRFLVVIGLIKKIPALIWTTFAVIGILIVGVTFGLSYTNSTIIPEPTEYQVLRTTNSKYLDLVRGYETLADLYYAQGKNVSTILDVETLRNNPDLAQKALSSMASVKDQINLQLGRIEEMRKNANLPERDLQKAQ